MKFRFAHNNFNVIDLGKSIAFYQEALGLKELHRKEAKDGSFIIVFMGDGESKHALEL
ncbi:MAG TPA: VOC family protein, partial [Sphaerochaeta sp.]|nr:VOC family protein [Sphaerochaeta sp.]